LLSGKGAAEIVSNWGKGIRGEKGRKSRMKYGQGGGLTRRTLGQRTIGKRKALTEWRDVTKKGGGGNTSK